MTTHNTQNNLAKIIPSEVSTLTDKNEIFELMVEAVVEYSLFALDTNGRILTWNSGGHKLKGYNAKEAVGAHFSIFFTHHDLVKNHPEYELEQARVFGKYQEEGWRIRKDGTLFWAGVIITALKDAEGDLKGFSKVIRDLTESRTAEMKHRAAYDSLEMRVEARTKELAHAKDEAWRAVKARDEFLSIASHELKTPLTSLKLQIQNRIRHINKGNTEDCNPKSLQKMAKNDEKQINRLVHLVNDMLDISRLSCGKFEFVVEETDLVSLTQEVLTRFRPQVDTSGASINLITDGAVVGLWDRFRLEQVICNLIANAIKYGHSNPITITVKGDDQKAVLLVKDEGIGIKKDDQVRIFQQYERAIAANSISGLGLGLYIVKKIVEFHDGLISVESELGIGSTFKVELPLFFDVENQKEKGNLFWGSDFKK